MAQEIFKHIKDRDASLREITFALNDETCFACFKDNAPGYIKYITYKLSKGPFSTIDIIIKVKGGIILIERSNPPFGWALPGGFLDYGESLEEAAIREAKEETGLDIYDLAQFRAYSEPDRDPRFHTVSNVFTAKAKGKPCASSDAKAVGIFDYSKIKNMQLAFDHNKIISDYFNAHN
ncbi:MAG: NUDIX hydrolase [Candidatus Omnitrophica bacterium]|nr:NUDIX hydrolase [Candidatus Omnitrophota bacterium]